MKKCLALGSLWLAAMGWIAGCAPPDPKYVAASTGRPGEIKFLYVDQNGRGIIKCARAEDGTLSGCRKMDIVLKGE